LKLIRIQPPIRRVLAVDAGSRCQRLLLAESNFGRLNILKEELIDLQAEGLVSADETKAHLQATLDDWGRPPLALVLPQHLSISQIIDLPAGPQDEVEKLILDETLKLGGVSESRIVYDFVSTEPSARNRQQFWVTLSQEGDIHERILQLGVEKDDLCDITTTANGLLSAYRASCPLSSRAILIHLGAQTTVVVVQLAGQGAFASSFQVGGDFFTRSLARLQGCAETAAESIKRDRDLLNGAQALPGFIAVIDNWATEVKRQLNEWFEHNPALAAEAASFGLIASGVAFDQPGLMEYLKHEAGLELSHWPKPSQPEIPVPGKGFEAAFGTALQALGHTTQPISLLPDDCRVTWQKRLVRQRIELASCVLLAICVLVLAIGSWHKASLILRKQALLRKVQAAQEAVTAKDALTSKLMGDYETLRPLLAGAQNTTDTLKMLALLQQSRSNRTFWYVLLADQQSYFSQPPIAATNKPARTNLLGAASDRPITLGSELSSFPTAATNPSPAKPGFIAELCVPEEAESARRTLSQLVNELKRQPLFSKVDLLSDDQHRNLADPKVTLADRHYVLALDFAATEFLQPLPLGKSPGTAARPPARRVARPGRAGTPVGAEPGDLP
jgi:hypothetical protein